MTVPKAYLQAVAAASKKYGVPADLLAAQIQGESGWRPDAKSPAGALGISQFMPGTAKGYGINPLDPLASIDAQGKMMGNLLKSYKGDVAKALAGYNAGSGAVAKYGGVPPYPETQKYIKNVLSYRKNYPGLAKGNLPLPDGSESTVKTPGNPSNPLYVKPEAPGSPAQPRELIPVGRESSQGISAGGGLTAGSFMQAALSTLGVQRQSSLAGVESRAPLAAIPKVSKLPLPDGTPSTVTAPGVTDDQIKGVEPGEPSKDWAGTHGVALPFMHLAVKNGLKVVSEKRPTVRTKSGGVSDHYSGNKTAYAYDLSNGSKPTPQMDMTAAQIAKSLGVYDQWKKQGEAGVLNVEKNGYRYQMLYRTNVGGNHFNHVHFGVRKL